MLMKRRSFIICLGLLVGLLGSKNTNAQCSASIVLTDTIKCFGDYATINIVTTGGVGWYDYVLEYELFSAWYQIAQNFTYDTATFTLLQANNYRITVTDTAGCFAQAFINITQPPNIDPTFTTISPSLCFGDSVADLHLNVFGGVLPYSVTLNNGPSTPIVANAIDFLNVPAGAYQVIITDANGCTKNQKPDNYFTSSISAKFYYFLQL